MKILLPLDGSDVSESALPTALALAQHWQAETILVRVADYTWGSESDESHYLDGLLQRFGGLPVRLLRPQGLPREILTQLASEEGSDLIIMASHGRSGVQRLLLGSVSEGVLRRSPCPVLLIRPESVHVPLGGFGDVLIPVDGSAPSRAVVDKISPYLARDARVTLMRASDPTLDGAQDGELRQLKLEGVQLDYRLVEGPAATAILAAAEEFHCDLIAMSTHGRSGLPRMVLGSVTESVARQAACPVLAFPHGHAVPIGREYALSSVSP